MKTQYFITSAPGYYGDISTVWSSHGTLAAAKKKKKNDPASVIREGEKTKGDEWLRVYEPHYPVVG